MELLESIQGLKNEIKGLDKLESKVKQELNFLVKTKFSEQLKKEHLVCSNLHHLKALISKLISEEKCDSVLEVYHYKDEYDENNKIWVDIVSHSKTKWTKVIARNPKALSQISKGDGEYQRKSVIDHAVEFLNCASQNSILYRPPLVEFHFACGIESELADELSKLGVYISGKVINGDQVESSFELNVPKKDLERNIQKLNLDVTAMIAYVSALTNGNAHKRVKGKVLSMQAESEKLNPVKPVLDKLFTGKQLFACKTVITTFNSILSTIGGEGEKKRALELIKRVTIIDDVPCESLKPCGQLKERSIIIFGSGQAIKAVTVTANSAFVRAARNQCIHFDVFFHNPRALTEKKEVD